MNYVLTGPNINLYINNTLYKEVQSVSFVVDYGEQPIFGIDSPYAQEIAVTKITVSGSVQGIRVKDSGGLQAKNIRSLFGDVAASPYISLRISDRISSEDILFIPAAKVVKESHAIATKSSYKLSFDFVGLVPLFALDRSRS